MSEYEPTDAQIVAEVLKNKEVFSVLIGRYEAPLSRYIRRLGIVSEEDIQDLLQNVFIKTYEHLNDFDMQLSFSSWIYRITHNETISFFRRRNVRPEGNSITDGDEVFATLMSEEEGPVELLQKEYEVSNIRKAMDALPDKYKNIIVLRFFEDKSYEEISDILCIPMGSVATLVHRAKKTLQKSVKTI